MTGTATKTACVSLALLALTLGGCSGGGGGGESRPSLSLTLAPGLLQATYYAGHPVNLGVDATVEGTVDGTVNVVVQDTVGVISPAILINQLSDTWYQATLRTATGLAPGHYQGDLQITLCGSPGCSPVYASEALPFDFTVLPMPAIAALSPAAVLAGRDSFTLTVTGTDFTPETLIQWNASDWPTTYVSATELRTQVDAGHVQAGAVVQVTLRQPAPGQPPVVSPATTFLIRNPVPVITSLDPPGTRPGWPDNIQLRVLGSGFLPGSSLLVNGLTYPRQYISPQELAVELPPSLLATGGTLSVAVLNTFPGGGSSPAAQFTIANAAPVVTAINPASIPVGSGTTLLAITGTGLQPNSAVTINGVARDAVYQSDELLYVTVPAGDLASVASLPVAVTNPPVGGGTSVPVALDVTGPTPVLAALDPPLTTAGCGAMTLAASGDSFLPESVININGAPRPTTFISSRRLTTPLAAAELAAGGALQLTVATAGPGGGTSNARPFTINAPGAATTSAVSWQVDAMHSGVARVRCPTAMPLTPTWTRTVNGRPGMMLVAGGRVFVSVQPFDISAPNELLALDAATGAVAWGPVSIPALIRLGHAPGRVLVAARTFADPNPQRWVSAYDENSGELQWNQPLPRVMEARMGAPVAADGRVFAYVDHGTYALDAATGAVIWSAVAVDAMPVVAAGAVVAGDYCSVYASEAPTGLERWRFDQNCRFSGSYQLGLSDGATFFTAGEGSFWEMFDAATGAGQGSLYSDYPPALQDGIAYAVRNQQLSRVVIASGTATSFTTAPVDSSPVLVNRSLYALTTGTNSVVAVDVDSGGVQWVAPASAAPRTYSGAGISPVPDAPVVGGGLLLVRGDNLITAFRIGE